MIPLQLNKTNYHQERIFLFLPYDQFRESNPDYVLLFAWNHATEIMKKERDYMGSDRHWITYIPEVKVD